MAPVWYGLIKLISIHTFFIITTYFLCQNILHGIIFTFSVYKHLQVLIETYSG